MATIPVRPTDRVDAVLARDPARTASLVEMLAGRHPQLARLRSATMRRVMARLVTVEQVARLTGEPVDALVAALNAALGIAATGVVPSPATPAAVAAPSARGWSPADEVELDVRDDLRHGREPFSRIMAAVAALAPHQVLHVRTTFEPVPLFAVLARRGFAHAAEPHAADDWSVWFHRPVASVRDDAPPPDAPPAVSTVVDDVADVTLDVRGLTPPQPLQRTLEALETLPSGATLVQVNDRVPQFLLPLLHERGFAFAVASSDDGIVRVRIRRAE